MHCTLMNMKREIVVVAHNIRSTYNVGSLFRTCDGLGVHKLYLTGYTPYPKANEDGRLPHVSERAGRQISKTALGAEQAVQWEHYDDVSALIGQLKSEGYVVVGLEQSRGSIPLHAYKPEEKVALLLGEEIKGIDPKLLEICDQIVEITMSGKKESFNVAVAAAITLYHILYTRS